MTGALIKKYIFKLGEYPRLGQPADECTEENIVDVAKAKCTYSYLYQVDIQLSAIMPTCGKLCTLWVPHNLTRDQRAPRVTWCKKMLKD
nr:unnamed protein product [Callosobruchus chinensis]